LDRPAQVNLRSLGSDQASIERTARPHHEARLGCCAGFSPGL